MQYFVFDHALVLPEYLVSVEYEGQSGGDRSEEAFLHRMGGVTDQVCGLVSMVL